MAVERLVRKNLQVVAEFFEAVVDGVRAGYGIRRRVEAGS